MSKPKIPNQRKASLEHNKRTERYLMLINQLYDKLNKEAAKIANRTGHDDSAPFFWSDYPETRTALQKLQADYISEMAAIIMAGTSKEWKESNRLQDLLANKVIKAYTGTDKAGKEYARYFEVDHDALKAFQQRRENGMNLSKRVWNLSKQYKTELEDAISAAIEPGQSAMSLAVSIKKYLNEPDLMFQRFRYKDENGRWKKKWKRKIIDDEGKTRFIDCDKGAYRNQWTGPGYYKSSAKNAQRLARTEINMAYRTAEQTRWKKFDFVVGYEIKTTQNGRHVPDICDDLKGKYPKTFLFRGWHPHCLCYCIPILKTVDEFFLDDVSSKSVNDVKDIPEGFKDWVKDNKERILQAEQSSGLPYFIKDNYDDVANILHMKKNASNEANPWVAKLSDELKRTGNLNGSQTMDENEIMKAWWQLTDDERIKVLCDGKFTGMIRSEGDLESSSLYLRIDKDGMLTAIQDQLQNLKDGYDVEDFNHYVIKLKNKEPIYSHDLSKPLTKAEINKLEWISANEGLSNYRYWSKDEKSLVDMLNHMGFVEYKDGAVIRSWNGKDLQGKTVVKNDAYRGNVFARTLDNIQTKLISRQFDNIVTFDELSAKASTLISKAVGNDVSVTINPDLMSMDIAKAHLTELLSITKDYKLRQGRLSEIRLGYHPQENSERGVTTYIPSQYKKVMSLSEIIDNRDAINAINNSRCDKDRLIFSLASHEGGHLLFTYNAPLNQEMNILKQSIYQIWKEYKTEFESMISTGDMSSASKILIGKYGHNNPSEFMAECFQEYRNSSNPSKYAKIIGKLLDSYFKK